MKKTGSWNTSREITRELAHVSTMKVECIDPNCQIKIKNGQGWCGEHQPKENDNADNT